jgi:uncharacterized membrane protein YkoI
MQMRFRICLLIAAFTLNPVFPSPARALTYLSQAKVTLKQARATALKAYLGKVIAEEIEKESGGSGLRYSFVISHGGIKHEVGIDAITGEVLENTIESPHSN